MPIYEYSCSECRRIFQFLARRLNPERQPVCPQCGNENLRKEVTKFAALKGAAEPGADMDALDSPKMERFMREMERDMGRLDENNPKHMAHMMRKMQEALPPDMMPREMNEAIRRLEAGEDPEAIEADMGEIFDDLPGSPGAGGGGGYTRDGGLYDL